MQAGRQEGHRKEACSVNVMRFIDICSNNPLLKILAGAYRLPGRPRGPAEDLKSDRQSLFPEKDQYVHLPPLNVVSVRIPKRLLESSCVICKHLSGWLSSWLVGRREEYNELPVPAPKQPATVSP